MAKETGEAKEPASTEEKEAAATAEVEHEPHTAIINNAQVGPMGEYICQSCGKPISPTAAGGYRHQPS